MAKVVPTVEPVQATAGSTWTWKHASAEFPVSEGWTLSYAIAGKSTLAWSASYISNDGTTHTVAIPASATASIEAGRYEITRIWTGSGSYSGQRFTEDLPPLTVLTDPGTVAPEDRLGFAEKNLAAVEAALSARYAGDEPEEYQIGNRSVRKMSLLDLKRTRAELHAEIRALRGERRSLHVRFLRPSA